MAANSFQISGVLMSSSASSGVSRQIVWNHGQTQMDDKLWCSEKRSVGRSLQGNVCECVHCVCARSLIVSLLWFSGCQIHFRWSILPVMPSMDSPSSLCVVPESGPFSGMVFLLPIPSVTASLLIQVDVPQKTPSREPSLDFILWPSLYQH